ncbi:outer membrane protein [Pseudoprimorskyibacter insulae]|uniref:Uncharacterized protein n=1 Tax=Pseudoprimorskyibacter insulae TaxID=1695997 RepID=A0A2R8ANU7_9RHOB|nr:outer membrane beta-barrel protein [Pseudoprimorskyibacter insulae]SPF77534.1 hypothetical protein PRI8871_00117 [Pseudoprimorskyibacter insulae]
MKHLILSASILALGAASPALAEMELSVYTGWQTSPHSRVKGTYPGTGAQYNALIGWEGKSFEMPPYYGIRGTWWRTERIGFGVEFTHAKVYAPAAERSAIGFNRMEFTDGHNLLTANMMYRWPDQWKTMTPYVGAGLGVAVPHVDVTTTTGFKTLGYQYTGPAAKLIAGAKYDLNDRYALFGEYQFSISQNEAELTGGGSMKTRIITNALNFGLAIKF